MKRPERANVQCKKEFLKCFYTNADSFLNKRTEILTVIESDIPDVICVSEVLPKFFKFQVQISEIKIDGYDCFTNIASDTQGIRGVGMYVRRELGAQQVVLRGGQAEAVESVWCEVPLQDDDKLLLGTVYRSPNSTPENNKRLNDLMKVLICDRSHVLITGDFNHPEIDWVEGTSPASIRQQYFWTLSEILFFTSARS